MKTTTDDILRFPNNFLWGAATSSYQIEGGWKEHGKGESIWDRLSHTPGKVRNDETGDVACDHYHNFLSDVDLMHELSIQAYRFSIAWPRIFPEGTGKQNPRGLAFYDQLVDRLLSRGIVPMITLYHWDLPQALEDRGGWRNKATAYAFADYAAAVVERLSDRVILWCTLNEMPCIAHLGYEQGIHAPGARESRRVVQQVVHNLLLAHGLGLQAIRQHARGPVEAGLAHNPAVKLPQTQMLGDIDFARETFYHCNYWWLDPIFRGAYPQDRWRTLGADVPEITPAEMRIISTPIDFFGLNVYTGNIVAPDETSAEGFREVEYSPTYPRTAMGWPITPSCIYWGLKFLAENYHIPRFYVTENGAAFDDAPGPDGVVKDPRRISYLRDHIAWMHRALAEGVNLSGYFVWSLLDNFEWQDGHSRRFGLVYTDYADQKRIPKSSARWYKKLAEKNEVLLREDIASYV